MALTRRLSGVVYDLRWEMTLSRRVAEMVVRLTFLSEARYDLTMLLVARISLW